MIRLSYPEFRNNLLVDDVRNILSSGRLSQGKYVERFERLIAAYLGVKYAAAVSSGTAALHLALLSLGVGKGDEIIVPSFCFPAVANVVELCNAKAVFCDINLSTFNIDIERIPMAISRKTKAIIIVHLFGNPVDVSKIYGFCQKRNIAIIEDAACALGASMRNKKCGTIGKIGCFSFHPRKIITTGEGGMVVTDDEVIYRKIKLLRSHGIDSNKDLLLPGFNYRMPEINALMGIEQIASLESKVQKRLAIAENYNRHLSDIANFVSFQKTLPQSRHVYQSYVVMLSNNVLRDRLLNYLINHSIESGFGTYAIHCLNYYVKKYKLSKFDFPNSYYAFRRSLSLPLHCKMRGEDTDFITGKIKSFLLRFKNER